MGFITRRRLNQNTKIEISKNAAALADENDVDFSSIKGTGRKGKITIGDIRAYLADQKKLSASPQGESEEE